MVTYIIYADNTEDVKKALIQRYKDKVEQLTNSIKSLEELKATQKLNKREKEHLSELLKERYVLQSELWFWESVEFMTKTEQKLIKEMKEA